MRTRGWSFAAIARRLGFTEEAVRKEVEREPRPQFWRMDRDDMIGALAMALEHADPGHRLLVLVDEWREQERQIRNPSAARRAA